MTKWIPTEEQERFAYSLVGEFMQFWSLLEYQLNECVADLSDLPETAERMIVMANMGVRDKLNAARTLFHFKRPPEGEDWLKETNKMLDAIGTVNAARNLVAHTHFGPDQKGGVRFFTVKAKGKFALPDVVWTPQMFADKHTQIMKLCKELRTRAATAKARRRQRGILGSLSPDSLGLLMTQPQSGFGFPQTNPETPPQTQEPPPPPKKGGRKT